MAVFNKRQLQAATAVVFAVHPNIVDLVTFMEQLNDSPSIFDHSNLAIVLEAISKPNRRLPRLRTFGAKRKGHRPKGGQDPLQAAANLHRRPSTIFFHAICNTLLKLRMSSRMWRAPRAVLENVFFCREKNHETPHFKPTFD
jgi:hypothetical protein